MYSLDGLLFLFGTSLLFHVQFELLLPDLHTGFGRGTKKPLDESERGEWKSWLKAQHSKNEDHGTWSHHFMANRWGNSKSYIWQTHSKQYPHWWKIENISSKVRNKTRVPTFTITIQHSFGSSGHSNQSRKRNKKNPNWKIRSKALTVCSWHDPLHRKP